MTSNVREKRRNKICFPTFLLYIFFVNLWQRKYLNKIPNKIEYFGHNNNLLQLLKASEDQFNYDKITGKSLPFIHTRFSMRHLVRVKVSHTWEDTFIFCLLPRCYVPKLHLPSRPDCGQPLDFSMDSVSDQFLIDSHLLFHNLRLILRYTVKWIEPR